jgi:hypothetical protein
MADAFTLPTATPCALGQPSFIGQYEHGQAIMSAADALQGVVLPGSWRQ